MRVSFQGLIPKKQSSQYYSMEDTRSNIMNNNSVNATPPIMAMCPAASNTAMILHALAYTILLLASLTGNLLVIFVIYYNKKMRTTVNWFIVNMSISDLIIPLVLIPRTLLVITTYSEAWTVGGSFGQGLCKFFFYITDITPAVSILSLVCMTIDRFYAVVFPLKAAIISKSYRVGLLTATWVIAMAFFSPYLANLELTETQHCTFLWSIKSHIIFSSSGCVVFVIIPFIILIVLYSLILITLQGRKVTGEELELQRKRREKTNLAVIKLALAVILAFTLCWGPYNALVFTYSFLWEFQTPIDMICTMNTVTNVVKFIAYSNSAINPLICFILNRNYREGLHRALTRGRELGHRTTNIYMTEETRGLCMESFHHRSKKNTV